MRLRCMVLNRPTVVFIEAAQGEGNFQFIETDVESDDAEDGELSSSIQQPALAC